MIREEYKNIALIAGKLNLIQHSSLLQKNLGKMPSGRLSVTSRSGAPVATTTGESMDAGRFQVDRVNASELNEPDTNLLTVNQQTYMYDKTLGQLTREALPKLDNYRDLASIHVGYRPNIDELHNATYYEKVSLPI